jgi:hypothetical protein
MQVRSTCRRGADAACHGHFRQCDAEAAIGNVVNAGERVRAGSGGAPASPRAFFFKQIDRRRCAFLAAKHIAQIGDWPIWCPRILVRR